MAAEEQPVGLHAHCYIRREAFTHAARRGPIYKCTCDDVL